MDIPSKHGRKTGHCGNALVIAVAVAVRLIVNRAPNGVLNEGTREEIEKQGLTLLGVVPHDDQVYEYDCDGKPTVRLPEDSPVRAALKKIVENLDL